MKQTVPISEIEPPPGRQEFQLNSHGDAVGSVETAEQGLPANSGQAEQDRVDVWDNRFVHWWLLGLSTAVIALSFCLRSSDETTVYLPVLNRPLPELCYSRRVFKLDCPGCGLTRCFINLSHGKFARAWQFHPAGFLLYGLIAFQIPFQSVQLWRIYHQRQPWRIPKWEVMFYVLAAMMIGTWAAKLFSFFFY